MPPATNSSPQSDLEHRDGESIRDYDGVTRKVRRVGPTPAIVKNRLRDEPRERTTPAEDDEISGDSRFSAAGDAWMLSIDSLVA